jgi:large subunit ribosomal protein L21
MKAVVKIGGKQFIVSEKETLMVDLLPEGTKELETDALLLIDGDKVTIGAPLVKGVKVKATVVEEKLAGEKLKIIRYKSKKRVHKQTGHRQKYSKIEIVSIK